MKKLFIETYGCQMNVADSEVVASIMQTIGYEPSNIFSVQKYSILFKPPNLKAQKVIQLVFCLKNEHF